MATGGEGVRRWSPRGASAAARRARSATATGLMGVLLATTALTTTALIAPAASAAPSFGDETLRLLRIAPNDQGATVDIAVPWSEAGRTLSPDAFEVSLADEPVSVTADRLTDQPLVVDLVIDPPADPAGVATLQGALAEFIGQLDPGARVRLVTAASISDLGQDRAAALDALRDLGSPDPNGFAVRLTEALGEDLPAGTAPASAVRVAVISSATAPVAALAASTGGSSLVRDGDFSPAVWARFHAVTTAEPTLAAFDTVAQELRSTYRIAVSGATTGQRISVQVTTDAGPARVTGTVTGTVAASPETAPAGTPPAETAPTATAAPETATRAGTTPPTEPEPVATGDDDGGGWLPIILAVMGMAVGVALCAVGAVLLSRRQRARADAPADVPVAHVATTDAPAPRPATARATVPRPTQPSRSTPNPDLPLVAIAAAPPPAPQEMEPMSPATTNAVARRPDQTPVRTTAPTPVPSPPEFDPTAMVSVAAVPARPRPETPLFSHEAEPRLTSSPMFDSAEALVPPVPPVFSSSINLESDVRIVRATAATERAIAALRSVHDERPDPTPRAMTVAIEAAASGWLENRRITSDEVVRLLDPERTGADPLARDIADGLLDLLEGHDRNVWDLALAFAERLGQPAIPRTHDHYGPATVASSLVEQVAAVVALGESEFVGRLGGMVGRGLLASWPSRTGRLQQLPLIVSPSLAAAADGLASGSVDPTDLIVGLMAVMEDAAMRMMRSEQGVAALRERYLDQVQRPLVPARGKFADKSAPPPPRWVSDGAPEPDTVDRRLVELIFGSPVVTTAGVAAELGIDRDRAAVALADLSDRGWLDRLAGDDTELVADRWLAREVLDQATKPFAPDYSPLDPVAIDLTVSFPRSVQHARS